MDINKILQSFEDKKIMVIGDIMVDRYLEGTVDRISPEAPVPIIRLQKKDNRLGGAANVALNLKALGAIPLLCSVKGADDIGQIFSALLVKEQISAALLMESTERVTTNKSRIIAKSQQMMRIDQEDQHPLSGKETQALKKIILKTILEDKPDAIILQDYNKGVLTHEVIRFVIDRANENNIPITVDPKKDNFFSFEGATLFKPNKVETEYALQASLDENLTEKITMLRETMPHQYSLVTLSEKGIYWNDGKQSAIAPTLPRNIADVCGAGDSVIAIATLGLVIGLPLAEIAQLSNRAGGLVCEHIGVVPISKSMLLKDFA